MRLFPLWLSLMFVVPLFAGPVSAQTACTGLCLQQVNCPTGSSTTVSGRVFAPNGVDPIPNVTVYIPNDAVAALPTGAVCPVPGQLPSGAPLVGTFSAADGTFALANAPVGTNIPLVIVAGKWRRQVVIPGTVACANTAMNVRFARNQAEGDIPQFAVATGSQDQVECVLRKVGLDDAEFTNPGGGGRIQLYTGTFNGGARIDAATPTEDKLMGDLPTLQAADVLMLPCEGGARTEPAAQLANLVSYANAGGRVYSSHYGYEWFWHNSPFDTVATWTGTGRQQLASGTATVNQGFASGATLAQWLQLVNASTAPGQIDLSTIRFDVSGVNPPTQAWLNLNPGGNVMQFTFDTPVGATAGQCGRVLFNEYHVESNGTSTGKTFPGECASAAMTPQEKLLEYSLFDLSNNGRPATMTPANATFGDQVVGYSSAPQVFTVTNNSVFAATLTSIATIDDFAATTTCGSVVSGGSCTISVTFKPSSVGPHTGTLKLVFGGTSLSAPLTGNGIAALAFQVASMDFGGTDVGTTVTRSLTLLNKAPGPVALPAFQVTGDYIATSSCPAALPAGGNCTLTLAFKPTVYGARPGTLTSTGANLVESLAGNGFDFSAAIAPTDGTVLAGLSTTPLVVATPLGGFSAPVTFSCTTAAPGMSCTLTNPLVALATEAQFNLAVNTTSEYTLVGYGSRGGWMLVVTTMVAGWVLLVRRRAAVLPTVLSLALLTALAGSLTGCSGKLPSRNPVFTAPGTYTVQLSATDGTLTRTATYMLTVIAH